MRKEINVMGKCCSKAQQEPRDGTVQIDNKLFNQDITVSGW